MTSPSPLIVPVFIPQARCPHRCVFCDQTVITGTSAVPDSSQVRERIETFLKGCRPASRPLEIAFYGGNFLGLPSRTITALLSEAATLLAVNGRGSIRFSTRPDTIDSERLRLIAPYPVETIELGAQSMDDAVLAAAGRGHRAEETRDAAMRIREADYRLGLQIMTGLPGDDEARSMETARRVAALSPDFVRMYPTVVVAGSPLAAMYSTGSYTPWSLERSVLLVKEMLLLFQGKGIPVVRMGLQATEDLKAGDTILAGPYHPAFGHLVWSEIAFHAAQAALDERIQTSGEALSGEILLKVHPRWDSRFRGMKNGNIARLKERYGFSAVKIRQDPLIPEGNVVIDTCLG